MLREWLKYLLTWVSAIIIIVIGWFVYSFIYNINKYNSDPNDNITRLVKTIFWVWVAFIIITVVVMIIWTIRNIKMIKNRNSYVESSSKADELKKLFELKKEGGISDEEYNKFKNKILKQK